MSAATATMLPRHSPTPALDKEQHHHGAHGHGHGHFHLAHHPQQHQQQHEEHPHAHDHDREVEALCALLPAELRPLASPSDCRRFLAATGGRLHESAKRLQATIMWRKETRPDHIVCHACLKDPRSHYMHVVGHDLQKRPIIYSCFSPCNNKVFKDNLDHMLQTFETAIKLMPPGSPEQWVWACDFHGFGMADVSPKLARAFLDISATHYAERLGMFLILDAPALFGVLWKAIQAFVDPKTHNKIRFVPYDPHSPKSELRRTLGEVCDAQMSDWLIREMAENRDHKLVPLKSYSMSHLHSSASKGDLAPLPEGQHDLRGSRALLQLYASSPALLEPQGAARLAATTHK